jgi:DNA-binding transcriptional MerR regulator
MSILTDYRSAMPYKEKTIEKKYFSIGEVAGMLGVSTSLIRFWESEFEIIRPKKNRKGNRQFTREDIDNVRLIYHLVKEKGYTLQGAKELIRNSGDHLPEKVEIIDSLKKIRSFLTSIRNQLS